VALVIADPPFQVSRKNNFHTMGRTGFDFAFDYDFDQKKWLRRISRVLQPGGNIIIFNDWKKLGLVASNLVGCEIKDHLVWIKANPRRANQKRRFLADKENMVWAVKGGGWAFNGIGVSSVFYHPVARVENRHPCEKPLGLMLELVEMLSRPGDLVLDPFMGHGVVGQACKKLGRKYLGFELESKYFEEAKRRLA
jgi:DNA modification methylase